MGAAIVKSFAFLPPPPSYGPEAVSVWVDRPQGTGRIPAIFASGAAGKHRRVPVTVLYTHGNAEDIGQAAEWLAHLARRCRVDVFAYDYPGYGLNAHEPASEAGCLRDIELCYRYLTTTRGLDPRWVVLMGRSLGSGPTVHLAALLSKRHERFGGVVVQSGLASCVRTVSTVLAHVPFTDMFQNISKIGYVEQPTLIVHGTADTVVPYWHGVALHNRLNPAAKWRMLSLDGAGHNDIEQLYYDELLTTFIDFFDMVEVRALAVTAARPPQPPAAS